MADEKLQKLRHSLREKLEALSHQVVNEQGKVDAQALEEAERLSRLIKEYGSALPPPRSDTRRRVVVGFLGAALLVGLMATVSCQETEVELSIVASKVTLSAAEPQRVLGALPVSELTVVGTRRIRFSQELAPAGEFVNAPEGEVLELSARLAGSGPSTGKLTLAETAIPAGARISYQQGESVGAYRMDIAGGSTGLRADLLGAVELDIPNEGTRDVVTKSSQSVHMEGGSEIALSLTMEGAARCIVCSPISVSELQFEALDEYHDNAFTMVETRSSVRSGVVVFYGLNGKKHELNRHEMLKFDVSNGHVRSIETTNDGNLQVRFHGVVKGLEVGSEQNPNSLMPSMLEWLKERNSVALAWASVLYLFGLLLSLMKFYGGEK